MNTSSLRRLFFTVELNLVLWIVAAVVTKGPLVVLVGLLVAAVLQHWAYYDLYKRLSRNPGEAHPST